MALNRRKLTRSERLLAAEASKVIVAAPGAGYKLRIFKVIVSVLTAAAQTVILGRSGGTVNEQVLVLAQSATGMSTWDSEEGLVLAENVALTAVAALAGPAVQFFVEYQVEPL